MNHREPSPSPAETHGKKLALLLGLLLALASTGSHAQTRSYSIAFVVHHQTEATPYLQVTGAPPLRFQEAAVPLHPAPAAPVPAAPAEPVAATPAPESPTPVEPTATLPATTEPAESTTSAPAQPATAEAATAPAKTPAPILPDDSRPPIRPEDFLPYFRIPGSARTPADVTLLVPVPPAPPAPGTLPPSSTTYTQSPK